MLSIPHMIVIFVVVLVVFGPQKLPELARGLGKLMAEFRKASTDFKSAFEEEMREMERQARVTELKKKAAAEVAAAEADSGNASQGSPAGTQNESSVPDSDTQLVGEPVILPAADAVARSGDIAEEAAAETQQDLSANDSRSDSTKDTPKGTAAELTETSQPIDSIHDKQQPA
jgi:TatA/E family protein of Tat protein translocase